MKKEKVMKMLAMHTACKTVDEIAKALRINATDIEAQLISRGYKPYYTTDAGKRTTDKPSDYKPEEITEKSPILCAEIKPQEKKVKRRNSVTDEEIERMAKLRQNGYTYKKIGEELGRAQSTVKMVLERYNKEKSAPVKTSAEQTKNKGAEVTAPIHNNSTTKSICQCKAQPDAFNIYEIVGKIGEMYDKMDPSAQRIWEMCEIYHMLIEIGKRLEKEGKQ